MLELNSGFRLATFVSLILTCFIPSAQSRCTRGCNLALGSYYVQSGDELAQISLRFNINNNNNILKYNPSIPNQDSLQAGQRINVPFSCGCINGDFLGHVFTYNIQSEDTYDKVAQKSYANLTTADWVQRFNSYDSFRIPDSGTLNVTVNCSCGDSLISKDYGLFVTYPLQPGETLDSVSSAANLSSDLIRRYNSGANLTTGSGLLYIPGRG